MKQIKVKLYYQTRYDFYRSNYWFTDHDDIFLPNGFTKLPIEIYSHFLEIINSRVNTNHCKILDLCCGNGLLLKFLSEHSDFIITPFGVDFQEKSINQAQTIIHKEFRENFKCENATNYNFNNNSFDIILIDPYHFQSADLDKIIQNARANSFEFILFYCYADVLSNLNYNSILDFPTINKLNLEMVNFSEVSFAIYDANGYGTSINRPYKSAKSRQIKKGCRF